MRKINFSSHFLTCKFIENCNSTFFLFIRTYHFWNVGTYSSSRKCVKNHYDSEIADDIFYDPPRVALGDKDKDETSDMSDIDTEVHALEDNSGRNHSKRNG